MTRTTWLLSCLAFLTFILLSASFTTLYSYSATATNFSSANSAINAAFSATLSAQQKGGNVSDLVAMLNIAIGLVQKAQAENGTNPFQATADLTNATQLAQQVSASAPAIEQAGSSARQIQYSESIGVAVVIVALAALAYIYGSRIYHLIWFYLYKNYSVRNPQNDR